MSIFSRKNKRQVDIAAKIAPTLTTDEETQVEEIKKQPFDLTKEFQGWLQSVHNMGDQQLSVGEQRKEMAKYLDRLSEDTYIAYFPQIVSIIQKSREKCAVFKNTEEQVSNILSWLPRLKDHEELLKLYIAERRKKYGLGV